MAVARHVWKRVAKRGFGLTRPPWHHATHNHAMGFCYLNNIAIVEQDLIMSEKVKRIAIVDLDFH
ncbi:MAG TPA: histone deacetylase family protein, partial [Anaerolineae bacterium]|nr:histone deacetylase family protein [Anaerolineae bacterium]